jgi:hypothetical protein
MKLTIETSDIQEIESLMELFQVMQLENVSVIPDQTARITRGDKKINPKELFGIWKRNPKDLEQIRSVAWQRN